MIILNRFVVGGVGLVVLWGGVGVGRGYAAPPLEPGVYGQEPWEMAPREYGEVEQRGYHDGVEGARRDFGNHRSPDVNNREEYRNSNLPPDVREVYRGAFRRGYQMAASHLWGTPPPPPMAPPRQDWDRWGMRGFDNDTQRQGYREGMEEARRDYQFHRNQDPDDQPQYRNPPVPPQFADEYRQGFVRGYEVGLSQLSGEPAWEGGGDPGQWRAPDRFTDMQRRGFQDGVEGARRDFGNHRRPFVGNREEYRDPHVPPELRHEYREGFRRGYEMAASRLWGGM